ncbi:serine/threonine-protein kinase [Nocardia sp. NPDC057353]|uniref:serine/threonine-protein kinase n=1 Tax=Nocardia sp. NPDC057353 TaxID=3346104 RepID=UPI00363F6554
MNAPRWFGEYRLDSVIGRGGMGQIWRAFHRPTKRFVALKVLPAELADDVEYRRRFEREARVAARLRNPHLVAIHAFGRVGDQLYIDMALVDGVDVSVLLRERGAMPPVRAVELLAQIGTAVDAAHAAGLVHRDIKPANVLIDPAGFAYLIDFGIAKPNDETGLTRTGTALGTVAYMAPERFEGVATAAADIYALGCVFAECLLGAKVFAGESVAEQIFGHLYKPPPRIGELRPGIPSALDDVVARALAKDPAERFDTALEFVDAARRALGAGPVAWNHGTAAATTPGDSAARSPDQGSSPGTDGKPFNHGTATDVFGGTYRGNGPRR